MDLFSIASTIASPHVIAFLELIPGLILTNVSISVMPRSQYKHSNFDRGFSRKSIWPVHSNKIMLLLQPHATRLTHSSPSHQTEQVIDFSKKMSLTRSLTRAKKHFISRDKVEIHLDQQSNEKIVYWAQTSGKMP